MTGKSNTMADVFLKEKIEFNEEAQALLVKAVRPASLINHTDVRTIHMMAITPQDFINEHSGTPFNLSTLMADFTKICTDYPNSLELEKPSYAVGFCAKVLYEIGPESRKVKAQSGDKVWTIKFLNLAGSGDKRTYTIGTAFICTYKVDGAVHVNDGQDLSMVLTMKQAGLLAIGVLNKIIAVAAQLPTPIYLLTPLAGAIFSKDDIPQLAKELNMPPKLVTMIINSSCQSGGQHLPNSRTHVAAAAAISATKNIKDKNVRESIISKTVKQYIMAKKEKLKFDHDLFRIYARYAHGGLTIDLLASNLIEGFDSAQLTARSLALASKQSVSESVVPALGDNVVNE